MAHPSLERADMDGNNRMIIRQWGRWWWPSNRCPGSMTLDKTSNKLYFADEGKHSIDVVDLATFSIARVVRNVDPVGIAVDHNYIYWSDYFRVSVMRTNKLTGNGFARIATGLWGPEDIHVYEDGKPLPGEI